MMTDNVNDNAMSAQRLPLVLRKSDELVVAVYDEAAATLTELCNGADDDKTHTAFRYSGDYRECEVCFSPAEAGAFAHATTSELRFSVVREAVCDKTSSGSKGNKVAAATPSLGYTCTLRYALPLSHVITHMTFSPRGTYLVTYAMMDAKRTPHGNLTVYEAATGTLLRRSMQARWPALVWTADEAFVVRPVQGALHVLQGDLRASSSSSSSSEDAKDKDDGDDNDSSSKDVQADATAATSSRNAALLGHVNLGLPQDKEIVYSTSPSEHYPFLLLYKPHHKQQQSTLSLYRLPDVRQGPLAQYSFARSESASLSWCPCGLHAAVLVQSERDPSGKSYYGSTTLHLLDVLKRTLSDVRLRQGGGGAGAVHDCQWTSASSPCSSSSSSSSADEMLLVVHGVMPRNQATLYNKHGVALLTLGEAPRNMAAWSPDSRRFVLGGSGNLAGDYQLYTLDKQKSSSSDSSNNSSNAAKATAPAQQQQRRALASTTATAATTATANVYSATCTGAFNEKSSTQQWAPDSYHFLCATVYTRLRVDNKLVVVTPSGRRVLTRKYDMLYGVHWVPTSRAPADYPPRTASPPRIAGEGSASPATSADGATAAAAAAAAAGKPQVYRPPGGTSVRAAALLARGRGGDGGATTMTSATAAATAAVKPAGPVGATVVVEKKKKKRH